VFNKFNCNKICL